MKKSKYTVNDIPSYQDVNATLLSNIQYTVKIKCDHCNRSFLKQKKYVNFNKVRKKKSFCSQKCKSDYKHRHTVELCSECKIPVTVRYCIYQKSKTKRFFCSKSCAATYNNCHKTYCVRRSKLEQYVEEHLKQDFPNLEMLCNNKSVINSELDFYYPSLKLAIELNGIVHYEPIYDINKLNQVQSNDKRKMIACNEAGIELIVINTAAHSYINKKTCDRFYQEVKTIINNKLVRTELLENS